MRASDPVLIYRLEIHDGVQFDEYLVRMHEKVAARLETSLNQLVVSRKLIYASVLELGADELSVADFSSMFLERYGFPITGFGPKDWRSK